ncbi:MAG: glycosyltransferase [Collinsella bouchesdurhonensis]
MQSDDTRVPSLKPILWMVIPCYNEEAVLPETSGTFLSELSGLISAEIVSEKSSILFVDDGSSDSTWTIIERLSNDDVRLARLVRSSGRFHERWV